MIEKNREHVLSVSDLERFQAGVGKEEVSQMLGFDVGGVASVVSEFGEGAGCREPVWKSGTLQPSVCGENEFHSEFFQR